MLNQSHFIIFYIFVIYVVGFVIWTNFKKRAKKKQKSKNLKIHKHIENPIISPIYDNDWENEGTFNPAAFIDDNKKIHILYRALGSEGISRIGYAEVNDDNAFIIDDRIGYPIYHTEITERPERTPLEYSPLYYASGGGWGGCEDPRAVIIDGIVYVTYVAFEGWHSVRIALTSISLSDFKKRKWNWKKPIFLSPKGEVHKNWVIFPEKINGKYAVLHSISPEIKIDYLENLWNFKEIKIKSKAPGGGRKGHWDNKMRGAGPPPLKTNLGWLVLYHAMDEKDPDKYKMGAMILDYKNPTKVLYRSIAPILEPTEHYENHGKPGVIYASGAVIKDDNLYVYYGGGDRVVCAMKTELNELLEFLKDHGKVKN